MPIRFASLVAVLLFALLGPSQAEDDWEPYRRTGLFPGDGRRWVAPDMAKESVEQFTARLLDGARGGEPRAMATLGRFFYVRGDASRAKDWLRKAAMAGHTGAQFDYGMLCSRGQGLELAEAYQWLWLATWEHEPGAEAALRELSGRAEMWHVVAGVRWAAEYQAARAKKAASVGP